MPTLFDSLGGALDGINVSGAIDGELGSLLSLIQTIGELVDDPPDEFGDYLSVLGELDLPDLDVSADLAAGLNAIRSAVPGDIDGVTAPVIDALTSLQGSASDGIGESIQPALDAINHLIVLFSGDLTCAMLPDSAPTGGDGGSGGGDGGGDPGDASAGGASAPQPVVSQAGIDSAKAAFDLLPEPLNVATLLNWVHGWGNADLPYNMLRAVPVLDEIRDPLATLMTWKGQSASQIVGEFAATMTALADLVNARGAGAITSLAARLESHLATLQPEQYAGHADTLSGALQNIGAAVQLGDLSGIDADLSAATTAIDAFDSLRVSYEADVSLPLGTAIDHIEQLPVQLEQNLNQLISLLRPRGGFNGFAGANDVVPDVTAEGLDELRVLFDRLQTFFENLLDAIDISALTDPVTEPLAQAADAVQSIDQQLVMLTLEVKQRFQQVEQAMALIDTSAMLAQAEDAINAFTGALTTALADTFAPVRTAIETAVDNIGVAVDSLDPEQIKAAVENAIQAIADLFDDPTIQGALQQVRKLHDIAQRLDEVTFAPVTDKVIEGVDEIKNALAAIDESSLTPPLPDMLDSAMAVLPPSIQPVTDPLLDSLGELIERGPLNVLEDIKDVPAQLFDQIREYDPESLIGDSLSGPYGEMLEKVERFAPSQLLEPLQQAFDGLKQRLADNVRPGLALQPLIELHEQVGTDIARFQPGDLIEPIDQQIQQVVGQMHDALPVGGIFDQLDGVIQRIRRQVDLGAQVVDLLQHISGKLDGFGDAPEQLDTWLDGIFDSLSPSTDISALTLPLQDLSDAIEATRSTSLSAMLTSSFAPLGSTLADTNADARLTTLVQRHAQLSRSAVEALPASPNRTALLDLLEQFDPTAAAFSAPFQQLARLRRATVNVEVALTLRLEGWDDRYHAPGGVLDQFNQPSAGIEQIKDWLRAAVDEQFTAPLRAILARVKPTVDLINGFIGMLADLVSALQAKLDELLSAPAALIALGDTVQGLIDTIAAINLDFLQDSVNEIFDAVRTQFNNLSPRPLQQALDDSFDELLDAVSFDQVVSAGSMDDLDDDFNALVDKLRQLDPDEVLVRPLQEAFEEAVMPLIEAFDLTPVIEAVIERLTPLEDELRDELQRVDTAYQSMLAAAP